MGYIPLGGFGPAPGLGRVTPTPLNTGLEVLEQDFPTIPLSHLVLEKLQIHEINWKDLVDLVVLFHAHDLCKPGVGKDCINADAIARVLADDWGFWYDAMVNLAKLKNIISSKANEGVISREDSELILSRVKALVDKIESTPKTKNWIKRSKIGTSKPWYREVEELER
ncbi:hypothetical protein Desfe_0427 [Desulfurococcus amylolyticus DSM 16532]|uniref:Uncharacterized protein n=1 Tax=Desulfurococcus amylolyticus DSM 16532 TaxID=768672 RepID=I3XQW3_DESAM|nr:hypothetical protein Desfe_0427 [Desulfurococcus amylolyticus DSM 16532]